MLASDSKITKIMSFVQEMHDSRSQKLFCVNLQPFNTLQIDLLHKTSIFNDFEKMRLCSTINLNFNGTGGCLFLGHHKH
jgi:hypothetical protein